MGKSDFLFAHPGFASGLAASIDIGGTLNTYNESRSPEEADMRALRSDWNSVGADIQEAAKNYEAQTAE